MTGVGGVETVDEVSYHHSVVLSLSKNLGSYSIVNLSDSCTSN